MKNASAVTDAEEDEEFGEFVATSKATELQFEGFKSKDLEENVKEMRHFLCKVFEIPELNQQPLAQKEWTLIEQETEQWYSKITQKVE